ncbi:phosphoenolpyruvate carboxykinase (ATP), partial [Staphylococcus epidermidis]|uniref:phosphoenolpyruvate carboxykinase (ATP) n=1 Tax=Staphylococcus epidermidis TaxID=1282 RepID=UPI0037DA3C38
MHHIITIHSSPNLPQKAHLPLFFPLSPTPNTTLSPHPKPNLIPHDQHPSNKNPLFNIHPPSYPKPIHLSKHKHPQIYNPIKYPTILQNTLTNDH